MQRVLWNSENLWWVNPALWENYACDTVNRVPEDTAFSRLLRQAQRERPPLVKFCLQIERWLIEHEKMFDMNARLDFIGSRIGIADRYGVKMLLDEASMYVEE